LRLESNLTTKHWVGVAVAITPLCGVSGNQKLGHFVGR